jgi:hypothetical protein
MTVQKIKSGRVIRTTADEFIGEQGTIFYNENLGDLRLSNGVTLGGVPLIIAGGGTGTNYVLTTATTSALGGIKVGANLSIDADGKLNALPSVSDSFKTIRVGGQSDLVAVSADTLEIVAGTGVTINTDAAASPYKTLTITASATTNIDGGTPFLVYGGIPSLDGGGI